MLGKEICFWGNGFEIVCNSIQEIDLGRGIHRKDCALGFALDNFLSLTISLVDGSGPQASEILRGNNISHPLLGTDIAYCKRSALEGCVSA